MDVHQVVYPFYVLSKLFGYTYFEIPRNDNKRLCPLLVTQKGGTGRPTEKRKIRQWTVVLTYAVIISGNVLLNVQQIIFAKSFARDSFSTVTGQLLSSGLFIGSGVMYITSMVHSLYFRNEVRLILDKFVQFDGIFQHHFSSFNRITHRRFVFGYIGGSVLMSLAIVPISMLVLESSSFTSYRAFSIEFLVFSYAAIMNYIVLQSQMILSVASVLFRLRAVNSELHSLLSTRNSSEKREAEAEGASSPGLASGNVNRVQQGRILHDILNDIVDLINICFAFHAMWCTVACVGFSLMSLYSDYEILMRTPADRSWKFIYVNFAWNCFYSMYSICIVWVASRMRSEASRTAALVHKIINANIEPALTDEVDQHHPRRSDASSLTQLGFLGARQE